MRVFPHRDWPQESGTGRPRRTFGARPWLEGLESRALLTVVSVTPSGSVPIKTDALPTVADVSPPTETRSPRTDHAVESKAASSSPVQTKPARREATVPAKGTDSPDRWVIDSVEAQPSAPDTLAAPDSPAATTQPAAAIKETEEIHDTLENAQLLPETGDLQLSGTAGVGESSDVYRVWLRPDMGSMTVSLANPDPTWRGEKHLQVMDEDGNIYGDIVLGAPNSHLSISMHPRVAGSERTLYLGVFVVSNDATADPTPAPYALSITQQIVDSTPIVSKPAGQSGAGYRTVVSTSPLIGASNFATFANSQPSPAQSDASASAAISESIEPVSVVNQSSAIRSAPKLIIAPDGGILSMGEGIATYEQSATAVDLALIDLDFPDEEPIDADAPGPVGEEDWEIALSRPAAGLPIALPTLEAPAPSPKVTTKDAAPVDLAQLSPPRVDASPDNSKQKPRRWRLLQTGVGIATAVAFALLMPDATLMLHDPKFRSRRRSQDPAKANPDQDGDL